MEFYKVRQSRGESNFEFFDDFNRLKLKLGTVTLRVQNHELGIVRKSK